MHLQGRMDEPRLRHAFARREEALFRIDASDFTNAAATWLPMSGQTMLKSSGQIESAEYEGGSASNSTRMRITLEWDLNIGPTAMPILTLAVDVYVSSTPNNLGWLLAMKMEGAIDTYSCTTIALAQTEREHRVNR